MYGMDFDKLYAQIRDCITDEALCSEVTGLIEAERQRAVNLRKAQQANGIARAKKENVHFGRKRTPKPKSYDKVMRMYANGDLSMADAAKLLCVSRSVFYSWICEERGKSSE